MKSCRAVDGFLEMLSSADPFPRGHDNSGCFPTRKIKGRDGKICWFGKVLVSESCSYFHPLAFWQV